MNRELLIKIFFIVTISIFFQATGQEKENTYTVKDWWNTSNGPFSPVVGDNQNITFRIKAPQAKDAVLVFGEWDVSNYEMQKDENGIWTVTLDSVEPQLYAYHFKIDGQKVLDLKNPKVKIGTEIYSNMVDVPADTPRFDQVQSLLGTIHKHSYQSDVLGKVRQLVVYTPREYDDHPDRKYPVLYLRHGGGDDENSWTSISGRAHVILENLIAGGKAVPMIIVMTNGFTEGTWASGSSREGMSLLEKELLHDVFPIIEGHYRVKANKENRAIAGLSMGGGQSFVIGLRNVNHFSWIGDFSSGLLSAVEFKPEEYIPEFYQNKFLFNKQLNLLWIACGTDDPRYEGHKQLSVKLNDLGIDHIYHDTPGGHEWMVWRVELMHFLQRIFKSNHYEN